MTQLTTAIIEPDNRISKGTMSAAYRHFRFFAVTHKQIGKRPNV